MADTPAANAGEEGLLFVEQHVEFIVRSAEDTNTMEFVLTEYLRMSGVYWGLTCLDLVGRLDALDAEKIISWVLRCQDTETGGFGGNEGHDPHILYTLSAVQILALYDKLNLIDAARVASYVAGLQQADGSFAGDKWGEVDTRFSYCALSCCSLLGRLSALDVAAATAFVGACRNFDGGFGATPGGESHAGQVFTAVGALAIGGALAEQVDSDLLGWWLAERQLPEGGLNGRPEKLADVCYSWWVLSSLAMLGRVSWIDTAALRRFILGCQDGVKGGISDRPDDEADVFHTFFGVAGLSLLGFPNLKPVDPVYALPVHVVQRLGLTTASAAVAAAGAAAAGKAGAGEGGAGAVGGAVGGGWCGGAGMAGATES